MCEAGTGRLNLNTITILMAFVGMFLGYCDLALVNTFAKSFAAIFVDLLKLISLPVIFLAIVSTVGGMKSSEVKSLGGRILSYTLLTTFLAAVVALGLYLLINPASSASLEQFSTSGVRATTDLLQRGNYAQFLLDSIPDNIVKPFLQHNVLGVLFLAIIISAALLTLPSKQKEPLNALFSSAFAVVIKITSFILYLMPIAVPSFVILFYKDVRDGLDLNSLLLYILCVVGANLIQAFIILPGLLLSKGLNPIKLLNGMWPALTIAFFSKSSAASLPSVLSCAEDRVGMRKSITRFAFPMCTTINMNACAGFILITVLFVSNMHGVTFSNLELFSWLFIATIAAIGNAAVPMGCYFLASSFLASQNIPLNVLGAILPIYTLLDMLETAINIWSDSCVTAIVNKELGAEV